MKFIKDSIRELKHVVWPTKEESRKYFVFVLSVLVLFGLYLFVASTIFSESIIALKNFVKPSETRIEISKPEIKVDTATGAVVKPIGEVNISTGNTSN